LNIVIFLAISMSVGSQVLPSSKNSRAVVFYNVENLFDVVNDPATNDDEFTPLSPKQWNEEKYKRKITDIAKVLASINDKELPLMIGLAEIENKKVLIDIVASSKLRKAKYKIVHFDSKDNQGLDVAFLYNSEEIEIINSKAIPVISPFDTVNVTRDILYVKCKFKDGNMFHLFVNHWPSRAPNKQDSEIKRITAAVTLRKEIDNILNFENNARIIIMGDFNDEPTNKSLLQILNASNKCKNLDYRDLYNLMYDMHNSGNEGSVNNQNNWQMFDQIIVSVSLFNKNNGYYLNFSDGKVFRDESLLFKDPATGFSVPNRTYDGDKYMGGTSGHLPVYVILKND
jgi:endonuclease/exonuclease/phosphatase family metal-dependent hydrolase